MPNKQITVKPFDKEFYEAAVPFIETVTITCLNSITLDTIEKLLVKDATGNVVNVRGKVQIIFNIPKGALSNLNIDQILSDIPDASIKRDEDSSGAIISGTFKDSKLGAFMYDQFRSQSEKELFTYEGGPLNVSGQPLSDFGQRRLANYL